MFINFCQIKTPTTSEQLLLDAYDIVQSYININIDKAYKADQYGLTDKALPYWDSVADIKYLIIYFWIVRMEILRDFKNCSLKTYSEYKEQYKLDCFQKTFSCKPIPYDIAELMNLFGLGPSSFGFEGIEFMAIEIDDEPVCNKSTVFEVEPNQP